MKKHMLRKDFFMEIKKSRGRFISIFFIVALGVAFYSGIRASEPSMRISGDAYFDKEHLMDLKVMSTMGLTEEDVQAIGEVNGIELAEGGYSKDVLFPVGDTEKVVHVMSMQENFNDVQVSEGRLPKKKGECLLDQDFEGAGEYEIGDTITLSSGDDTPLTDSLATDTFTIVGFGNSPLYISFGRGSSDIGNGEVSGFLAVDESSFSMDVYSEAYVKVEDAERETAFTSGYTDLTDAAKDALKKIEIGRCKVRYDEIVGEAQGELDGAEQEIEEKSQTLAQAQQDLEDGNAKARQQLETSRKVLEDGEAKLEAAKQQIADGKVQLEAGKAETLRQQKILEDGKAEYEVGIAEMQEKARELEEAEEKYLAEYTKYMPLIQGAKKRIAEDKAEIMAQREQLQEQREQLNRVLLPMRELSQQLQEVRTILQEKEQALQEGQSRYDRILGKPSSEWTEEEKSFVKAWEEIKNNLNKEISDNMEQEAKLVQTITDTYGSEEVFRERLEQLEGQSQELDGAEQKLAAWEETVLGLEKTVLEQEEKLLTAGKQIQDGKAQLEQARQQMAGIKQQLDAGEVQLQDAFALLHQKELELQSGQTVVESNAKELRQGWSQYEEGAALAAQQIADGQEKLADGKRQMDDAKQQVADARAELQKIEKPKWYIQDRSDALAEYDGYGDNADRMRAIGKVFPVVFFLVAALISLTAMTRMVEEQRIQIGTLKALGYGKSAIAGKYIAYALSATFGGSVVGVLLGEKIFPWIIIYAYKIMYQHIPDILVPYHLSYAVQATLIAVLCTLAATAAACWKELAAVPAELMRPPAPKQGQRILLERVKFIWKHLSFIWKSSIRNLVRYKKRFFMTLFGIGGCMALMVVGFGLKDCIFEIPSLQYGEIQYYDAAVYYDAELPEERKDEIANSIQKEPAVDAVMKVRMQNLEVKAKGETEDVYLTVPESAKEMEQFIDFHSRTKPETYSLMKDQVILTEKAAQVLDVEVGDKVTLEDEDRGDKEVTIGAICENYMGHYLYLSPEYYESIFGAPARYNGVLYKTVSGKEGQIEEIGSRLLENKDVLNVTYTSSIEEQLDDMLKSLNLVIVVLIVSAGMLAFVVLYNLNTINITERKRELATIKVLGFYDKEVASYVYRENILLTLIGAIAGMGIGRILLQFIVVTVEVDDVMFGRVIHFPSYFLSFLFTLAFSFFVNWVMYFKLKRIDMVESLKSVE